MVWSGLDWRVSRNVQGRFYSVELLQMMMVAMQSVASHCLELSGECRRL